MRRIMGMTFAAALGLACRLQAGEAVAIYHLTDMLGQSGYMILNKEQFAKLSAEIKDEERAFPAAMAEAKKKWDDDKTNMAAKGPFPMSRIKPRALKKVGSDFTDMELAKKRLAQAERAAAERADTKSAASQRQNPTADDLKHEQAKARAFAEAVSQANMQMANRLGRPVPAFGFTTPEDPNKKP